MSADVPHPAVPPLSPAQLARGRQIGERLDAITADLSAWMDEVGRATPELMDAAIYGDRALTAIQQARVEVGTFAMNVAEST